MNLGKPTDIKITPNAERNEFRLHLTFPEKPQILSFVLSADGLMYLLHALQHLQARKKIPIPDPMRTHGKPVLRVVTDDDVS